MHGTRLVEIISFSSQNFEVLDYQKIKKPHPLVFKPDNDFEIEKKYHLVFFVCVGVMYSGEYDVCDVTLSVHPHWAS